MIAILASVPGKLKTLLDRLTSTRAANLDKLDANVTTRAPAATALTNAVWTDARAERLDSIADSPVDMAPIAAGILPANSLSGFASSIDLTKVCPYVAAGSSFSYTGAGVLNFVASKNPTGSSVTSTCTITIDGVVAYSSSAPLAANSSHCHVGTLWADGLALDQVPFRSSITIACTGTTVYYKLRKTA